MKIPGPIITILLSLGLLLYCGMSTGYAQSKKAGKPKHHLPDTLNPDSIKILPKRGVLGKLVRAGIKSINKDKRESLKQDRFIKKKSETQYENYKGYHIRNISYTKLGFQNRVTDTTNQLLVFGTRLLNTIHTNSKDWVIANNMFVHEGDSVRPYIIADNERYLRTLPFLQDARINIKPIKGSKDSVDLEVVTRDILSLRGGLDLADTKRARGNASDINFLGMGQTIQAVGLYDYQRVPVTGFSGFYAKNSILGSFIDAAVGYTAINPNIYDLKEEESAYFLQLSRPLVSPYSLFTGGLYLGHKFSENHYPDRPDTAYYNYRNNVFDAWVGYNIAGRQLLRSDVRDRKILAIRYASSLFDEVPYQVKDKLNTGFNDKIMTLGSITFFRQNFYKTNYVYGFGITEDIPYGYNVSVTAGWHKQLYLERPYAGLKADKYAISPEGDFFRYTFRAGSFLHKGVLQDAGILVGGSVFSRLLHWRKNKIRQYAALSYTRQFNSLTQEPLHINNPFGLNYFEYQNLAGYQRVSLNVESSMFLNYRLLGFRFAPFVSANAAVLTPDGYKDIFKSDLYTGFGGGLRARNEDLVFNTLELRFIFFPREIEGAPSLRLVFSRNIRYRYNSNYVTMPDVINWNLDDQ